MSAGFWLSDQAWAAVEPILPTNRPGARRVDDCRVISGIVPVLRIGCRWEDGPASFGPLTTICNQFNRWSHRGLWGRIFATLAAQTDLPDDLGVIPTAARPSFRTRRKWGAKIQAAHFRIGGARLGVQPPKSMP